MGRIVTTRTAEYPRPDHFLLHISDTHVLAGGGKLYDRVESERHLQALFEEFEASGGRPDAIVEEAVTGEHVRVADVEEEVVRPGVLGRSNRHVSSDRSVSARPWASGST